MEFLVHGLAIGAAACLGLSLAFCVISIVWTVLEISLSFTKSSLAGDWWLVKTTWLACAIFLVAGLSLYAVYWIFK